MANNIERNHRLYGGFNPGIYDVLFTHGEMDPMRTIGVTEDLNPRSPAIVMPGESIVWFQYFSIFIFFFLLGISGNKDFGSPSDTDDPILLETKARARSLILQWIGYSENERL